VSTNLKETKKSTQSSQLNILGVDVGGTNAKILLTVWRTPREFVSEH